MLKRRLTRAPIYAKQMFQIILQSFSLPPFLVENQHKKAEGFEFSILQQGSATVRSRTALFLSNTTPPTSFPHRKLQIFKNPRFHRVFWHYTAQRSFPKSRVPLWCRSVERPAATNPGLEISEARIGFSVPGIESSVPAIAADPFVSTTRPTPFSAVQQNNPTPGNLHG